MALRCGQLVGRTLGKLAAATSLKSARGSVLAKTPPPPPLETLVAVRPIHFLRNTSTGVTGHGSCTLCGTSQVNNTCSCRYHRTGADKEIQEFLVEEIASEVKSQKFESVPSIEGFQLTTEEAFITLTRKFNEETIKVTVNINHSVDSDDSEDELDKAPGKDDEVSRLESKPNFKIEINRGGKVMEFLCSISTDMWLNHPSDPQEYNDVFVIDELVTYEGDRKDSTYVVAGAIMDGHLYDLLMNVLDERGITNQFAEKLVDFCTAYEHKLYIGLLERIKTFFGGK